MPMNEQFTDVGPVTLCYETFGDPADPAMLLIMGLATQMVGWHEDFCAELVERGFYVIRFDNRDAGHSTIVDAPPPSEREILTRRIKNLPYTLADMADDAANLLDHLGIERAHIVGASMGGMIAQHFAMRYPARTLTLTSIMSTVGGRVWGQPRLSVLPMFLARPQPGKEAYVERIVTTFKVVGSQRYFDEEHLREIGERQWERGVDQAAAARQLGAIIADGNRAKRLRRITVPTLVIHGRDDKLVKPSGGSMTARAIPGAKLLMLDDMGHDLPRPLWPRIIDAIAQNATRAADKEVVASAT
jgi:pimeloyl-ACP methyl ester carboxylesterase